MSAPADVVRDLLSRLDKSIVSGGLLEGWTFDRQPVERVEGDSDKNSLFISMPHETEAAKGSQIADVSIQFNFSVSTVKVPIRTDVSLIDEGITGHLDAVSAFKNAVELSAADVRLTDVLMGGKLIEPMSWEQSAVDVKTSSFNTGLTLTLKLTAVQRGKR
ncbi:hypothetical protein CCP3SC15_3340004 [Gammaproteobacteria bacterium]